MYKIVRHHTNQGHRVAMIINKGSKWTHLIYYDYPIRVRKVLNKESRYMKHLTKYDCDRGMDFAIKTMRKMALMSYGHKERNIPLNVRKVYNDYSKENSHRKLH